MPPPCTLTPTREISRNQAYASVPSSQLVRTESKCYTGCVSMLLQEPAQSLPCPAHG